MPALAPHPDRLFDPDPGVRSLARRLHAAVADAPIVSPHGHVPAALLADDAPFPDPAALLVTPDHYVTRLLHAHGVPLERLGLSRDGAPPEATGREVWRELCAHWAVFAGTPVRTWLESELADVFGVDVQPSPAVADAIWDRIAEALAQPEFRPRALFDRFRIDVLATTDDPADDLAAHAALAADPSFTGRVVPTFRADAYLQPDRPGWASRLDALAATSGVDCGSRAGMLEAFRVRRAAFRAHGGTATDTGVPDARAEPLAAAEGERIHAAALAGRATPAEGDAYRRDLLYRLAEMSAEDGMVMQLHAGVLRNTHAPTFRAFGPDTGHDLPAAGGYTRPLAAVLDDFGDDPRFRIVLFTVDETLFSREIGPLAGFHPAVYAGAPWWFLDSPDAIARYRLAVTDSAGFGKTSGFIDDTRAFCSIPARHDVSRRVDADVLAGMVARHRLQEDEAFDLARDLADALPRRVFRL